MKNIALTTILIFASWLYPKLTFSQVEVQILDSDQNGYISTNSLVINIDSNTTTNIYSFTKQYRLVNLSTVDTVQFYYSLDWYCSNSILSAQICDDHGDGMSTCHTYHDFGLRVYPMVYTLYPAGNNNKNFKNFKVNIRDYEVENKYQKRGLIRFIKNNSNVIYDSFYLIINRGTLPCSEDNIGLGIKTNTSNNFNIFPNPANAYIQLKFDNNTAWKGFALYSIDGRMIKNGKAEDIKDNKLNVSDMTEGLYFLKIIDKQNNSHFKKVTIKHH